VCSGQVAALRRNSGGRRTGVSEGRIWLPSRRRNSGSRNPGAGRPALPLRSSDSPPGLSHAEARGSRRALVLIAEGAEVKGGRRAVLGFQTDALPKPGSPLNGMTAITEIITRTSGAGSFLTRETRGPRRHAWIRDDAESPVFRPSALRPRITGFRTHAPSGEPTDARTTSSRGKPCAHAVRKQ